MLVRVRGASRLVIVYRSQEIPNTEVTYSISFYFESKLPFVQNRNVFPCLFFSFLSVCQNHKTGGKKITLGKVHCYHRDTCQKMTQSYCHLISHNFSWLPFFAGNFAIFTLHISVEGPALLSWCFDNHIDKRPKYTTCKGERTVTKGSK